MVEAYSRPLLNLASLGQTLTGLGHGVPAPNVPRKLLTHTGLAMRREGPWGLRSTVRGRPRA